MSVVCCGVTGCVACGVPQMPRRVDVLCVCVFVLVRYSLNGLTGDMNWMYSIGSPVSAGVSPIMDDNNVVYVGLTMGKV